jgi:hypothetical protein
VPKTPKSGAGLERNQVPLSAEITCRFRPKSGAGLLRFLQLDPRILRIAEAIGRQLARERSSPPPSMTTSRQHGDPSLPNRPLTFLG